MDGHGVPDRLALGGRTISQGMFGGIALVLGIVGLAILDMHPGVELYLDAIAQIALGLALIVFGMALAAGYGRLIARAEPAAVAGGAMAGPTADMFLGGGVVVLGILALLRIVPAVLIPIEVILVGVGLILNSAASVRAAVLETNLTADRSPVRRVAEELVFATASLRAVAGVAVGILGIIALTGADVAVLTLAAAIVAGGALLLASTSFNSRVAGTVLPRVP